MLVCSFISRVLWLFEPYIIGKLINEIQKGWPDLWHTVLLYLSLLAITPLLAWSFHATSRLLEEKLWFFTTKNMKEQLFAMITALPMQRHTDHHSGETIDKVTKAVHGVDEYVRSFHMHMYALINCIGGIVALSLIWALGGVLIAIMGVLVYIAVILIDKKLVLILRERNTKEHDVSKLFFDYLSNIKTIITLRFQWRVFDTIQTYIGRVRRPYRKHNVLNEKKWFIMDIVLNLSVLVIVGLFCYQQLNTTGTILIGTLTMIRGYFGSLRNGFDNITWNYSMTVQNYTNAQLVNPIIDEYNNLPATYQLPQLRDRKVIAISNLHFSYKDTQKHSHTLADVDMSIHAGEKIAVVGESGSGKSTFLSLLRGLYDVDRVTVNIDGKKYDHLHVLSHNSSLVPQEPEIFEDTISYNISVDLDTDAETIEKFSHMACFHDVALALPHEYKTNIKEKWVNLSGGQKQRLALARGLLVSHDSDILLLDESTSSVDSINEKKIYQNIFHAYPKKTIVAAIHKLHLLPMFQTIYVFENGKIIESGTFEGLIAQWGKFTHMWKEYSEHMHEENL